MMFGGVPIRNWSSTGQVVFYSSLGGFILTKFVDAFTAAMIANAHNKSIPEADVSLVLQDQTSDCLSITGTDRRAEVLLSRCRPA